jgi:hypothetical protein
LRDGQLDESIERICGPAVPDAPPPEGRFSLPPMSNVPGTDVDIPKAPPPAAMEPAPPSQQLVPRRPAPTLTDLVLADLEAARARNASPPPKPARGTPASGTPRAARPSGSRYAAPRPAAIFAPADNHGSLFGGGSISEKSLDEVILSYLAEDLDGAPEK